MKFHVLILVFFEFLGCKTTSSSNVKEISNESFKSAFNTVLATPRITMKIDETLSRAFKIQTGGFHLCFGRDTGVDDFGELIVWASNSNCTAHKEVVALPLMWRGSARGTVETLTNLKVGSYK